MRFTNTLLPIANRVASKSPPYKCRLLPGISLGEIAITLSAIGTPISNLSHQEPIPIGISTAMVLIIPLKNEKLLKKESIAVKLQN